MPPPLKQQGRAPCYIWKEQPTGDAHEEPHTVSVSPHQRKPQISTGKGFQEKGFHNHQNCVERHFEGEPGEVLRVLGD